MRYVSTVGDAPAVGLEEALFAGLAPDGGLYMPERLEPLAPELLQDLSGSGLVETATLVARHLLGEDVPEPALTDLVTDALDFEIPLVPLDERYFVLELFHGPTLAFKDVGARFMARLMAHFRQQDERPLTILAATSGDTGSAVAHAFFGVPGIRVLVLFPSGQVSEAQQKLFSTLGGNVVAVEVEGTFDDCQRLAKEAFADGRLRERQPLASANSINIGRLLPQLFYYFHLVAQLPSPPTPEHPLLVATPSGNFGNLTAGLMAKRLGLAVERFVAATNVNDVVPEYLANGIFRPRPSRRTLSNAMDVGDPSNLQRIRHLYDDDVDWLRSDLLGLSVTDEETVETLSRARERWGYVLDPHGAVGLRALERVLGNASRRTRGVVLATAHPAKFADVVSEAIGEPVPLPEALADHLAREESTVPIAAEYGALRRLIDDARG